MHYCCTELTNILICHIKDTKIRLFRKFINNWILTTFKIWHFLYRKLITKYITDKSFLLTFNLTKGYLIRCMKARNVYGMIQSCLFIIEPNDVCLCNGGSLHIFQIKLSECDECCSFLVLLLFITMLYRYFCWADFRKAWSNKVPPVFASKATAGVW